MTDDEMLFYASMVIVTIVCAYIIWKRSCSTCDMCPMNKVCSGNKKGEDQRGKTPGYGRPGS